MIDNILCIVNMLRSDIETWRTIFKHADYGLYYYFEPGGRPFESVRARHKIKGGYVSQSIILDQKQMERF